MKFLSILILSFFKEICLFILNMEHNEQASSLIRTQFCFSFINGPYKENSLYNIRIFKDQETCIQLYHMHTIFNYTDSLSQPFSLCCQWANYKSVYFIIILLSNLFYAPASSLSFSWFCIKLVSYLPTTQKSCGLDNFRGLDSFSI